MVQQHKASILSEVKGELIVGDRNTPAPEKNQVLVKITAAGVNPIDWKIQQGYFPASFPVPLGLDGAGVVEAAGPGVSKFGVGDRIFFLSNYHPDQSTFQQHALIDIDAASKTPNNISDDQASTISAGAFTAFLALFQDTGIEPPFTKQTGSGKGVLILGGSSSVGQYAIQLAHIAGFAPIVTTSSAQHTELLKSLGATHVFDRDVDAETIRSAFPNPVELALDAISIPSTWKLALDVLSTPGSHLSLVLPADDSTKARIAKGKIVLHQVYASPPAWRELSISFWDALGKWVEQGKVVPNRVQVVPGGLAAVPNALELSRKGVSGVKLVIAWT